MPTYLVPSNRVAQRQVRGSRFAWLSWMRLVCAGLFTGWAVADEDAPKRLPIPNAEALRAADKQVRDIFQTEFAAAKRPSDKSALAEQLLQHAKNDGDDAVAQYVLFDAARTLAVEADEFQLTFNVIDELVSRFELNEYELKAAALTTGSKELRSVIAQRGFCELIVESVDAAAREEQFDAAAKLVPLLSVSASKIKDASVRKEFLARHSELKQLQTQWTAITKAKSTLEKTPDDAVANGAYGRYLCLLAGNWEKGLPLLAKGTDPTLSKAAKQELEEQATPEEQLSLADAWWTVGQSESGIAKQNLLLQAKANYEKAANELKGLSRTKADQRIDVITKLYPNEVQRQVQNARGKTFGELRSGSLSGEKAKQTDKPTSKPMNGKGVLAFGKFDREVAQSLLSIDGRVTVGIKSTETGNLRIVSKTTPLPNAPFALTYLIVHSQATRSDALGKDDYLKIAKLSNLQTLHFNLNGKPLPDEFWDDFRSSGSIVDLSLSGARATDAAIAALSKPPRLRSLELGSTLITDASLGQIASFPALETLGVSRTRVTGDGLKLLAKSPVKLLRAESLGLKDSDIESLSTLTRLEELTLSDDTLTGEGFRSFKGRGSLRFLNLKSAKLSPLGVQRIAEISTLASLSLREVEFDEVLFKSLCGQGRIETFNLVDCTVPEAALRHLAATPALKSVNLRGAKITGSGFRGIAPLLSVTNVLLGKTEVDDAGLAHVVRAFPNVTTLYLDETAITDAGMKHLRSLARLDNLVIGRTRVTAKGLTELATLPKLRFLGLPKTVTAAEAKTIVPQCSGFGSY